MRFLLLLALLGVPASAGAQTASPATGDESRVRARSLGVSLGTYPTGTLNAITDVPGVTVGHTTLISGDGTLVPGKGPVRTGVTVVIPRDDVWRKKVPAGSFVLNGTGEMTGLAWVEESGFLEYPIALTNTLNLPRVADGVMSWMIARYPDIGIRDDTLTPVVAECDDGRLNDIQGRHVSEADVIKALDRARGGPVAEGTVGAGTGMISYGFKGGIGTASRVIPSATGGYTVGVLVNTNSGRREELLMGGVPVGKLYGGAKAAEGPEGSIIIVIATDAPLDARQLKRLAKRAALGLARTGSTARHGSGDFILAFSTGNVIPHYPKERTFPFTAFADTHLNPLFVATVEATQEAILNALTMATTVVGRDGHKAEAMDLKRVREILKNYGGKVKE
ncbi:MAG: S58 family peptidase [Nitrospiraceae bacterium]|nr:MAG: S58 family peptidase [Nitrospiraceae bacterium]